MGMSGYWLCLWQCRLCTPKQGVVLLAQDDNFIELHDGSTEFVGKISKAMVFYDILILRLVSYSGERKKVFIVRSALSTQAWARLCRLSLLHYAAMEPK